jgi:hypothetical protein
MHSPAAFGCGAHPYQTILTRMHADVVVGVVVARLLGNQTSSHHYTSWYVLIPLSVSSRAPETPSQRHTHPGSIHPPLPRVRYALGIGFGKQAASCYHLYATQARQRLKTGPGIGLGYFSGMLRAGGWKSRLQAAGKQKAGKLVLAPCRSFDHSIPIPAPRSAAHASDISSVDLARSRAGEVGSHIPSASHRQVAGPSKHVVEER